MTQRERQILQLIETNPMISQQELAEELGITRSSVAVHISNLMSKGHIAGRGYVLRSGSYAVVVGGVNVDIGGKSFAPLIAADSNPGSVKISLGGVGRNIAHNLSLLGTDVRMLTAFGDDIHGQRIAASCSELGIDASHARRITGGTTSTYLYLTDEQGEMALAVSDMEICKKITPTYLAGNMSLLQNAQLVIADANIPQESLIFLAENCTAPLFCDPVSTTKAEKIRPILNRIHTLKPNKLEAELLSGVKIETKEDVAKAVDKLLEMGVRVTDSDDAIRVRSIGAHRAVTFKTQVYPGFPTDLQQPMSAMLCTASGTSTGVENIFESRFRHLMEMERMGARVRIFDRTAVIEGVPQLHGAAVEASDLRAGAALVVAGLMAQGNTEITNTHFIDRGYEHLEDKLSNLGAKISRVKY